MHSLALHTERPKRAEFLSACILILFAVFGFVPTADLYGQTELKIKDICRLKGQEENTLQGLGLVVGLKGTGDGDLKPMVRALTRATQLMGGQVSSDMQGRLNEKELANAKNVALVMVSARIPPAGAEQGDQLQCTVSAISAKSLEGGTLMLTPLLGPRADRPTVYALAQGPIVLEDRKVPTSGKIVEGCKMELAVKNEFVANQMITLVLDPDHTSFTTSQLIEDIINDFDRAGSISQSQINGTSLGKYATLARAVDQMHVEVKLPPNYRERPVQFVSLIMNLDLINLQKNKRVVIQEREGVIIIGEDVTIAPVAINHGSLSISTRSGGPKSFVGVSSRDGSQDRPTLKNLVDALNVLAVPTSDVIAIIKALKRQGNLYGELIVE